MQRTSDTGIELTKQCEGLTLEVRPDPIGIPSIGYGHRVLPSETFIGAITEEKAEQILAHDIANAEWAVSSYVRVPLTQGQFDATVDAVYNIGVGTKGVKDGIFVLKSGQQSTFLKLLNSGDYKAAGEQLLLWCHAGGKVLPGLKIRREAELALWNGEGDK